MSFPINTVMRALSGKTRYTAIVTATGVRALRVNDQTWSKNGVRAEMPEWKCVEEFVNSLEPGSQWSVNFTPEKGYFDAARAAYYAAFLADFKNTYGVAHANFRASCDVLAHMWNLTKDQGNQYVYTYSGKTPQIMKTQHDELLAAYNHANIALAVATTAKEMADKDFDDAMSATRATTVAYEAFVAKHGVM